MKINDIINEGKTGPGLWANINAKRERIKGGSGERMRKPGSKGAPTAQNFKDAASEGVAEGFNGEYDDEAGMAETNLHTIARAAKGLLDTIDDQENLPEWVQEKIAKVEGMMVSAWDYLKSQEEQGVDPRQGMAEMVGYNQGRSVQPAGRTTGGKNPFSTPVNSGKSRLQQMKDAGKKDWFSIQENDEKLEETYHDDDEFFEAYGVMEYNDEMINEAEYQGRKVTLNKPMQGDVKKFKVYVKNPKGNVVKVNFGQKGAKIKKNNPGRRKNFRARHNCDNPGPKTGARYWSCRKW